ncbi:MAG TPA: T9SS type A sorting domain-containing protein [Fluviicola sp.]|nr:T9SS type A sorting domain-containing protein [Fluviicola sp.]
MRLLAFLIVVPTFVFGQTFGPNSPTSGLSTIGIGATAWTNPGNILTSNNSDATVSAITTTNYLQGTGFGFNVLSTDIVTGIRLEVEKASNNVQNVSRVGNWSVGTTRTLPSGTNRCLVVVIGFENASVRDITSVTYGGRALTQLTDLGIATPFYGKNEVWYLLESELALASGTTISYTYGPSVASEDFQIVAAAVFENVDQIAPFNDFESSATSSGNDQYQLGTPVSTLPGSMTVTSVFCGNPPDPAQSLGNSNAFSINNGFTEVVDYHAANAGFQSSGGVLQVAQKSSSAVGTEQPTFTFDGTPNRTIAIAFSLRRARQMDYSVRLRKSSGLVGTDKAIVNTEWPTSDTYSSYGGAGDLWGTTWTYNEVNNANFGGAFSAIVQNGTATVDHMRITLYTTSVLPVELVNFSAEQTSNEVACSWITATERNTNVFVLERSINGIDFEPIGMVDAAGNSTSPINYAFTDKNPAAGMNYYRLLTIDTDGSSTYSDVVSVNFTRTAETSVYPNPASDWTTIVTPNGFDAIIISTANGQIIDSFNGKSLQTSQQLNVDRMADGVYFVTIKSAEGNVEIKQLVKTTKGF